MNSSLEQFFAELAEIATHHPIPTIIGLTVVLLSTAVHGFHIAFEVLLLVVRSVRQDIGELGEAAQRFRDEFRLWRLQPIDRDPVRPISLEEARAHLRREGLEPIATIRVVSALSDAWLAHRSRMAFNVVTNERPRAGLEQPRPRRYQLRPASLGSVRPGIDLDKALALSDALEDEHLVNEIGQRK